MEIRKTLICEAVPNVVYISKPDDIRANSFTLSLVSSEASGVSRACPPCEGDGAPRITIQCDWNDHAGSLCSLEDAQNIQVSSGEWKTKWKRTGWETAPPQGADLSKGFQVLFRFDYVVTDLTEGTAVLHIVLHHFPGYDEEAPFTAVFWRRYALSVEYFVSDKPKTEYGDFCTLSWKVQNSSACFMDGRQVKAEDSCDVFPTADPQSYFLLAENSYGASLPSYLTVGLTNWAGIEAGSQECLPIAEETCGCNAEIYKYEGNYYTFAARSLYTADNLEKPEWKKLSGPEAGAQDFDFYTCLQWDGCFLAICGSVLYRYTFADGTWSSGQILLDYGDDTVCRAVLFQNSPLYAAVVEKNMLVLSYYEERLDIWDTNYFLEEKAEIEDFDMVEFQGSLYLALKQKSGGLIIYRTEDLEDWKKTDTAQGSAWFRLLACKRRLFLVQDDKITDLEGGSLYPDVPKLPEAGKGIRVCMEEDRAYLVFPADEKQVNGYRFRP